MRIASKVLARNFLATLENLVDHKPNSIKGMWEAEIPIKLLPLWILIRDYLAEDPGVLAFAHLRTQAKILGHLDESFQERSTTCPKHHQVLH